jgi:predicted SprT family Zn-dependent metalloprotease
MGQLSLPLWTTDRPERPSSAGAPQAQPQDGAGLVLAARLGTLLREPVEVELTDNAWTMVSWKRLAGRLQFRLHHMFCGAAEPVVRALAGFTGKNRRQHGAIIDEFVRTHRHLIKSAKAKPETSLAARGRVHDLTDIYDQLNAQHFERRVAARIGWGRRPPDGRRRSIKMGVYFHEQKLIRIHPALDDEQVPRHFVGLVVFHEMLHQVVPPTTGGSGRRTVHGREFRAAERRFPDYERARAWEKANLHLLLRRRG